MMIGLFTQLAANRRPIYWVWVAVVMILIAIATGWVLLLLVLVAVVGGMIIAHADVILNWLIRRAIRND